MPRTGRKRGHPGGSRLKLMLQGKDQDERLEFFVRYLRAYYRRKRMKANRELLKEADEERKGKA